MVRETADAISLVLDVPADLRDAFDYDAGQFCTFRVFVDGQQHHRCYSMSSSPESDDPLQVTIKRVPGGVVSNWMVDALGPGDEVEATCPAGVFGLAAAVGGGDLVMFSGGSGITPVISVVKSALATTDRTVRVLYANRDRHSIIFAAELDELEAASAGRLTVTHHIDVEHGFVDADVVRNLARVVHDADHFVCGPAPFMDLVEGTLLEVGTAPERIHIERFTAAEMLAASTDPSPSRITIDLDGRSATADHHPGTTILQTARQMGMAPPFSCESGSCATCMARVVEGTVTMYVNNALTDDEVAEGWALTCQAIPASAIIRVVYGYEEA